MGSLPDWIAAVSAVAASVIAWRAYKQADKASTAAAGAEKAIIDARHQVFNSLVAMMTDMRFMPQGGAGGAGGAGGNIIGGDGIAGDGGHGGAGGGGLKS